MEKKTIFHPSAINKFILLTLKTLFNLIQFMFARFMKGYSMKTGNMSSPSFIRSEIMRHGSVVLDEC